nr:nicotinate (nicotinamide) nucleotide adenylyltransferase [Mariprofundus sp. KV]
MFGGTFDPPHNGHLALVEAGLQVMGLDEVLVIPAEPVHRSLSGRADGMQRLRWLQTVFAANERVSVVDWEVARGRPVAAVETLREFRKANPEIVPWLLLGADAWAGLPGWREYPAHLQLCNVAVFARQGLDAEMVEHAGWQQVEPDMWRSCESPGHYCYLQPDLPDISATALRRDAEMGRSLAGRVPEQVIAEVEKSYQIVD